MKNIRSREDFLLIKETQLNEGLFGFLKGLVKGISKMYNKVKGGKEIQAKIDEYEKKIKSVFQTMASEENKANKVDQTVQPAVESIIFEDNGPASDAAEGNGDPQNVSGAGAGVTASGEQAKTDEREQAQGIKDAKDLQERQSKKKLKVTKERIEEIKGNFKKEIDVLKKKFTNKDGSMSNKVEALTNLASVQLSDFVYNEWEEYFKNVGDPKTIKNIQKQRANVAQEMQKQSKALQQMLEGGDKEKRTFEVDKKYNYTNSNDKPVEITVKEVGEDGSVLSAELVNDNGETVTINPYTDKIGKKVEPPQEEAIDDTKETDETKKVNKVQVNTKQQNEN